MATVRYDTLGVFVGPTKVSGNLSSGDINQLSRVQSTSYNIELQRENTLGLGSAFANDNIKLAPFVNLGIEYLITNGENEKNLGFVVDGEHGSIFDLNSGERDFFLLVNKPNETPVTMAIGNGMLMKYGVSAQVGSFVKANIDVRGFNIKLDAGTSGNTIASVDLNGNGSSYTYQLPPVDNTVASRTVGGIEDNVYVGQGQMDIKFPNNSVFATALSGSAKSFLQSFAFDVGLDRGEITKLGQRYPFKRCLTLPMELTLSADVILSNFVADNIQNYFCQNDYDVEITIHSNACSGIDKFWETEYNKEKMKYIFRGLKLKSFASADSIGDRKKVTFAWSVPVGNLLDLNRNLFISGDFGRYAFPLDNVRTLSGEQTVTGQNLQPLVTEFVYKRVKQDVQFPEFDLSMVSNLDISRDYPASYTFFEGNSGIYDLSGKFGSGIVEQDTPWNSDSFSTVVDGLPSSGVAPLYSLIEPQYAVGYPANLEQKTGIYNFYFKGEGINTEPVELTIAGLPTWITPYIQYPKFQISPDKPYYFNTFGLTVNAIDTPTGQAFNFQMIAKTSKLKKIYKFAARTPYAFPVVLPTYYSKKTSIWLDPYNETKVTRDANNFVSEVDSSALRGTQFLSITGSGANPFYNYTGLNGKSFLDFASGEYLVYSGVSGARFLQDFRNFSFFAVYKPNFTSESGCTLLKFYNSNTGVLNGGAQAFFGRKALSNDLIFNYSNPTGTSGFAATGTPNLQVTSTFDTVNWNLGSIIYDGAIASGRRNGAVVGTQNMTIANSGWFDTVEVASRDYHGSIAEIILFPYKLQTNEIVEVENYLRYKWGF